MSRERALTATITVMLSLATLFSDARADSLDWAAMPLPSLDGGTLDPSDLKGRVVLVVNTASMCGFTPQYEGLQELWQTYRERGLVVLGVPSDDFGGQEYDTEAETKSFCELTYGIDFPMLTHQHVKGGDAHPLFAWIGREAGALGRPKWNFYKYLIGPDGRLLEWFSSATGPRSSAVTTAVEKALADIRPVTGRPALDPELPWEDQLHHWRAELWTPAGAPDWQARRRAAAAWLVARTEARSARDAARLSADT